ncbi:hypothetical protein AMTRI_Chr02g260880 [Amborella trichopoda]|uniref:protein DOWNY MILDEW RESISTANCE 6 n=1 Tax=Amborella trichopoda TaxID=13333 RepID=UPI0005D35D8A|nr:protein DOWNY MILDEW RESISTANCE 6 [Amborella trichopoda]|eukprot:XP_011620512.1 protein DOWNY MILDEW RESISTANCE 6 [Amborella trichopoda]
MANTPEAPDLDLKKGVKNLVDNWGALQALPPNYILPLPRCSLPVLEAPIPVIDMSCLYEHPDCRLHTVRDIGLACSQWGFFRVINHGVNVSLMQEMLKSVEAFFSLPWDEKMKYASDNVMDPVRYGTSMNSSAPHALHWRDYFRHFGHPVHNTVHLWPHMPPGYKKVAKEYLEAVWHLALRLAGAISQSLGLEESYIEASLGEGCQIIASNYYPPCPQPHQTLGLSAHSDHGGLTVLMQNDVDGLQVRHEDTWVPIRHMEDTFIINVGDYLEILSNGRYKSVEHRAVVNEKRTRISIAVGHGPELSTIVAPATMLISGGEKAKYRPVVYADYMRMQQSSVIRGKTPLESLRID